MNTISPRSTKRHGYFLVEAAIATVLVGLLMVASLQSTGWVLRSSHNRQTRRLGDELADRLLAEALGQPYADPDGTGLLGFESGEGGSTRASFDDVDDYDGWSASPQTKTGAALTGTSGWTETVVVTRRQASNPENLALSDQGVKRIVVTVTAPTGETFTRTALRTSAGLMEKGNGVSAQTGLTVSGTDSDGQPFHLGIAPANHATAP